MRGMQREINLLKDELEDKDRLIERLEQETDKLNIEFDVSGLNKRERTHSTPAREVRSIALSPIKSTSHGDQSRSRSLSPVRRKKDGPTPRQGDLRHRLLQTERKLDDTKNMLRLKVKGGGGGGQGQLVFSPFSKISVRSFKYDLHQYGIFFYN